MPLNESHQMYGFDTDLRSRNYQNFACGICKFTACLVTFLLSLVSRFSPKKRGRDTLVSGMRTGRASGFL